MVWHLRLHRFSIEPLAGLIELYAAHFTLFQRRSEIVTVENKIKPDAEDFERVRKDGGEDGANEPQNETTPEVC